jgi:geranylgeranyl reductase family protein
VSVTEADVLVVGGGPSGAATAYHLARHGVDVLLVDRATFPREKVCGDGLTPRGVRALQAMGVQPLQTPGFTVVDGLRVHGPGVHLDLAWPELSSFPRYGVVSTRHDLDHLLLRQAIGAGARVWEGAEAQAPLLDGAWITGASVKRNGTAEEVRARFVIACDGASSRFASRAGVRRDPRRPIGIAARRYFRSPKGDTTFLESWLDLWDERRLMAGYGWIFPVGGGVVNVGAGLLSSYVRFGAWNARRVYDLFVNHVGEEWGLDEAEALGPILSGPLPMGMNRNPLSLPGVLVVGDAGGIINPFNGEGIAYAMESGQLAAELVHEALARGRPAIAHVYPAVLRQRYGRYFTAGRAFVRAIGHPTVMRVATRLGLPRERFMRFALRVLANISDGREGDAEDRVMDMLVRMSPEG